MCQTYFDMPKSSEAIEDYAKAIYALSRDRVGPVLNGEVAERLGVTPATATAMLQKLDRLGLVEDYLTEALGMPSDRVHAEAEVLEHYISEELELLIAAKLGEPSHDPHGTPIPGPDLLPPAKE